MKGQPCLIESSEPLKPGTPVTVLCGKEIRDSFFTLTWDHHVHGTIVFLQGEKLCAKCRKAFAEILSRPAEPGKRYLYGVLESSEVKRGAEDIE